MGGVCLFVVVGARGRGREWGWAYCFDVFALGRFRRHFLVLDCFFWW